LNSSQTNILKDSFAESGPTSPGLKGKNNNGNSDCIPQVMDEHRIAKYNQNRLNSDGARYMDPDVAKALAALGPYLQLRNMRAKDLYRFKDIKEIREKSEYFSIPEFQKILVSMDLDLSERQLRDTCYYLDAEGNGKLNVGEIEEAIHKAKRQAAPRDTMSKLADIVRHDPFAGLLNMPTCIALNSVTKK